MAKTKNRQGPKKSWDRAKKLSRLADHDKVADARTFLSGLNGHGAILDTPRPSKRNPAVKKISEDFRAWLEAGHKAPPRGWAAKSSKERRSKGDPTRPPRAGTPKQYKKRVPRTRDGQVPMQLLFDLRQVQKKHGVELAEMAKCIEQWREILS